MTTRNNSSRLFPLLAGVLLAISLLAAGGAAWLRWGATRPAIGDQATAGDPPPAAATPALTAPATSAAPATAPSATNTAPAATATPSPTATPAATSTPAIYVVQPGDTLVGIADQLGVTVDELVALNGLANADFIVPDQRLLLPGDEPVGPTPLPPDPAATQPGETAAAASPAATSVSPTPPTPIPVTPFADGAEIVGASFGSRPIEHYTFGDGPAQVIFVGALHGGYEWNTANLAYEMVEYFGNNPAAVPEVITLHIIPVANPDGLARVADGWSSGPIPPPTGVISDTYAGRFNGRDVDLNRNWDCNWQPTGIWRDTVVDAGQEPFSEPEVNALRTFFMSQQPRVVVFWHSAAGTVLAGRCGDEEHEPSLALGAVYAAAAEYSTQGALGYEINGDASDWLTTQGIPSFAVELTNHSDIEWQRNLNGTLAVLRRVAAECAEGACEVDDR